MGISSGISSGAGAQGPEGPQGPPGPVGPVGLEWRGLWDSGISYAPDDAVGYSGASYFCISANIGTPPTELPTDTNWALLAAEGMIGPTGPKGEQGEQGPPGVSPITSDSFQYDTFNYLGLTSISPGSFVNILGLPGIYKATGGTAGITIGFGVLKFPANSKPTGITFSLQITGTVEGASGTAREWKIQLRRPNGTTIVRSASTVKVSGTDISNRDVDITSRTFNATDLFTTQGVMVGIQNDSGQTITLISASLTVHRYLNQS